MTTAHTATPTESSEYRNRINQAIAECDRFIDREEKRIASLRPADVQKMLDFYKSHKAKLQGILQ